MQMLRSFGLRPTLLLGLGVSSWAGETSSNPLSTALQLVDDLIAKLTKEGEAESKTYAEYVEWCDHMSMDAGFSIETSVNMKASLEAKIGQLTSAISVAGSRIEELAAAIANAEAELRDATAIREKEAKDFAASEAELKDIIDTLSRAIAILSREMAKNPAAFAQLDTTNAASTLKALSALLDAASFPGQDQAKLTAFVQAHQQDQSDDADFGAPAAAAYRSHSSDIVDVLEDMKEKAEAQLSDLRKAEVNARHNFELLRQSLQDQIAADSKDMESEKAASAAASQTKTTTEAELSVCVKELTSTRQQLAVDKSSCSTVGADHEASVAARTEELRVLVQAKSILTATTSGAESQTYSLLQIHASSDLAGSEVVAKVKQLAKQQHSTELEQLASRIVGVLRFGSGGDQFAKVKGLIRDMIARLEKAAGAEATEKAYCDEQLAKTEARKAELEDDVSRQTSRIDQATARATQLSAEIKTLEAELAALAKSQAEMDRIRHEQHADYVTAKADLELGLTGVRKAIGLLQEYYGAAALVQTSLTAPAEPETHSKSSGAGQSIISILQVVEADFAKNLAETEADEADALSSYEKITQQNAITRTSKTEGIEYRTQEMHAQQKTAAEYSADRDTTNSELSAILDYYAKIRDRCIAKPETYAERAARRAAEIQGLKEALTILEDETALVQQRKRHTSFRGALAL